MKKSNHKNISEGANDNSELRAIWDEAYDHELWKLAWADRFLGATFFGGILISIFGTQQFALYAFIAAALSFYKTLTTFMDCSNINYLLHRLDIDEQREKFDKSRG